MVHDYWEPKEPKETPPPPSPSEVISDNQGSIWDGRPKPSSSSAHGSQFQPPDTATYNGDADHKSEVAVNTEALNHFVSQLDKIVTDGGGILMNARTKLDGLNIRPGAFAKAELLRQQIVGVSSGSAGLRGETMALLMAVQEALYAVKMGIAKTVKGYDTAEELNGMTADQLKDSMEGAWAKIKSVTEVKTTQGSTKSG